MEKAYKFRIYPNHAQLEQINKTIGCTRFVYNHFLDQRIKAYNTEGRTLNYSACSALLTQLKNELQWLKEVDKFALQNSLRDLDKAYKNFFNGSGFPRFKSKHKAKQAYRTNLTNGNIELDLSQQKIKLPKLGWLELHRSKKLAAIEGKLLNATVSKSKSGKYFVAVAYEVEIIKLPEPSNYAIGIDLGIKEFAVLSTGEIIANPQWLKSSAKKLSSSQRRLSKKQQGSKNREKARRKVAVQHEKVTNQRKDFLHKLSKRLIIENQVICLEGLNIKGMVKNRKLAKAISDAGWGIFGTFLSYKAKWYGRDMVEINTFFPSSKLCSNCKTTNPMLTLSDREWQCPNCGTIHHRDLNAAINILNEGLRLHQVS